MNRKHIIGWLLIGLMMVSCGTFRNINEDGPTTLKTSAGDEATVQPKKTEAGLLLELIEVMPANIDEDTRTQRKLVAMLSPLLKTALGWSIALLIIGGAISLALKTGVTQMIGNTLAIAGSIGVALVLFLMKTIAMLAHPVTTWVVAIIILSILLILLACLKDRGMQLPSFSSVLSSARSRVVKTKEHDNEGRRIGASPVSTSKEDVSAKAGEEVIAGSNGEAGHDGSSVSGS